jgi:hypothetical protein
VDGTRNGEGQGGRQRRNRVVAQREHNLDVEWLCANGGKVRGGEDGDMGTIKKAHQRDPNGPREGPAHFRSIFGPEMRSVDNRPTARFSYLGQLGNDQRLVVFYTPVLASLHIPSAMPLMKPLALLHRHYCLVAWTPAPALIANLWTLKSCVLCKEQTGAP